MLVPRRYLILVSLSLLFIAGVASTPCLAAKDATPYQFLYFESDTSGLRPDSLQALNRVIAELKANPGWRMTIAGHTDDSGDVKTNQRLSLARAKTVQDLIIAGGIDARRLVVQGYGETRPLSDNSTPEGRAYNRRVELYKVLPKAPQAFMPTTHFEFASVVEGNEVVHEFRIQNKGQGPLVIEKVKTG
jgi:hypothetical protein